VLCLKIPDLRRSHRRSNCRVARNKFVDGLQWEANKLREDRNLPWEATLLERHQALRSGLDAANRRNGSSWRELPLQRTVHDADLIIQART